MIPRLRPKLGFSELAALFRWPSDTDVEKYEQAFASKMDAKFAIAFPYGRTAIQILLEALELRDKEVITPAYTCAVVQNAVIFSGNQVVFVDSQESDFNMDLSQLRTKTSSKTGAIIATSIFG